MTNIKNISVLSSAVLFFLITFAPFHFYPIKAPFFFLVSVGVFLKLASSGASKAVFQENIVLINWTIYYMILGLFFFSWGLGSAVEGSAPYTILLYIAYPLVYLYLMLGLDENIVDMLQRILVWSSGLVAIYIILNIITVAGIGGSSIGVIDIGLARGSTMEGGIGRVSLVSISTLVFSGPYLLSILQSPKVPDFLNIPRSVLSIVLVVVIAGILLSGRRALFLIFIISFFTYYGLSVFLPRNESRKIFLKAPKKIATFTVVLFLISIYGLRAVEFDFFTYLEKIISTFSESGDLLRTQQSTSLLSAWGESPIFGHGHGVAAEMIRSEDKPWRYEKSYYALLFHTGIAGVIAYSLGIFWIFRRGYYVIKRGGEGAYNTIGLLNGLLAILIAYSSNPYLDAIDILWVIFLPAWYVNHQYRNIYYHGRESMAYKNTSQI